MSDEGAILKIHRQFSKDESIQFLFRIIKENENKIEKLVDENQILKQKTKELNKLLSSLKFKFSILNRYFKVKFCKDNKLTLKKNVEINEEAEQEIMEVMNVG